MRKKRSSTKKENRTFERVATDVRAIVSFKQESDETWKEVTNLISISRSGCSFNLSRPCQVGRLVAMVSPLPREFRAYDHDEELFSVIGLVQHCLETATEGDERYTVGVAFVGKNVPDSYQADPLQSYHICGTTESGMWNIAESKKAFQVRNAPRFWISMDVIITLIRKDEREKAKDEALTTNISATGASVLSSLSTKVGDRVKFASKVHNFYSMAVVRNTRKGNGKSSVIHLEFVDNRFPIEKLAASNVTAVTDQDQGSEPADVSNVKDAEIVTWP